MPSLPVFSPDQSAAWDASAVDGGVALATLMECAGRAAAAVLAARYAHRLRDGVLVAAGPGHNGGDGWVLARALHRLEVPVWVTAPPGPGAELREAMAARARAEGVREVAPDGPWPSVGVVVDALLGTGARGAPRAADGGALERMLDLEVPVVAIDGPTGVDLQTGISHGAPRADLSITFGGLRRGHLLARDEVGTVVVTDIGHPPADPAWPILVTDQQAAEWLRRLRSRDHKGARGRVVIVGGDAGMIGAARMAGRSAFGAGAGLVHVVAPPESVAALVQAEPDLQTLAHALDQPPSEALLDLVRRADARRDRPRASGATPRAARSSRRWCARPGRWCSTPMRSSRFRGRCPSSARWPGARWCSRRTRASSGRCFPTSRPSASSIRGRRRRRRPALPARRCCSRACRR